MSETEEVKVATQDIDTTDDTTASVEEVKQRIRQMTRDADDGEQTLPAALHENVINERNDVMAVINELEDQLDRQQEVRESVERELTQANSKAQAATQRVQELEWQVVTLQTRVEALEQSCQEITLLEEEVANANARMQRLTEEYKGLEQERTRLRNELKTANKQLEELWSIRKERDGLRADARDLATKIEELERVQRDAQEERIQLQGRLQETVAALEESRSERHQQQNSLRTAIDRANELTRIQEELADKVETVRAEKKAIQAHVAHIERENVRLVEQRQFYETELASLRNTNRNAEVALSNIKKAFAEVRVALTETKTRARRRMMETWPRIGIAVRSGDAGNTDIVSEPTEAVGSVSTSGGNGTH